MTSSGAYESEMGRFLRLSDEELSRLLAGEAGVHDQAFDEVAALLDEVRAYIGPAGEDDRARHIAAITEAAQLEADRPAATAPAPVSVSQPERATWRKVMDRGISIALKAVAATVVASMSMMGLAYAGVNLPGQAAEKALEAVTGLELPNQGPEQQSQGSSVADDVRSVLDGDLEGCELGQAVADAADANRQDDATTDTDPCTKSQAAGAQGSRATGEEKSAQGHATASESGGASDTGADNAGTNDAQGRATGDEASTSGRETGSSKPEEGQSKNPTDNGRP